MVPISNILACVANLLVTLVLPLVVAAVYAGKHRGDKIWPAWLLGAAGFFVPQMLIRVPVLQALSGQAWFLSFSQNHTVLYYLILAVTAGLFELTGRFAAAKILNQKQLSYRRAVAAGLGHGGVEAMLLVGVAYLSYLAMIGLINSGTFDTVVSQASGMGADPSALLLIQDTLVNGSPWMLMLGGLERILSMTAHLGMSVLVCYGVHSGKPWEASLVCLGIHTVIDFSVVIQLLLPQSTAFLVIYSILTLVALLSIRIVRYVQAHWGDCNHAEKK